jgi:hypothetical protein
MTMTPEQLAAWRDIASNTNPCVPARVSIARSDLAAILAMVPEGGPGAELAAARREAAEWRIIAESTFGASAVEAVAEVKGYTL